VLMGDGKQLQSMVMSPVCPRYKTIWIFPYVAGDYFSFLLISLVCMAKCCVLCWLLCCVLCQLLWYILEGRLYSAGNIPTHLHKCIMIILQTCGSCFCIY
jgi:hypothetical protein